MRRSRSTKRCEIKKSIRRHRRHEVVFLLVTLAYALMSVGRYSVVERHELPKTDQMMPLSRELELQFPQKQSTPATRPSNCEKSHHVVFDQLQVAAPSNSSPRILCFVMSHSGSHATKIKAIWDTWGKRCDKLVVASNRTDPSINAVAMKSPSDYLGLWTKLNETLQYLYDEYRTDEYDWLYKADDDTYAIVENLKEYLSSSPGPAGNSNNRSAAIYGRVYSSPRYKDLKKNKDFYFKDPQNVDFGRRFYQRINKNDHVLYNYGGPGYIMNWPYVEQFLEANRGPDTLHGTPAEDMGHGVVMAYHGFWPQNTRDEMGRERFHPERAEWMFSPGEKLMKKFNRVHKTTGGLSNGTECCSEQSIAFHHMQPAQILRMDQILYACRGLE